MTIGVYDKDRALKIQRAAVKAASEVFHDELSKIIDTKDDKELDVILHGLANTAHVHTTALEIEGESRRYLPIQFVVKFGSMVGDKEIEQMRRKPKGLDNDVVFVPYTGEENN